MPILLKVKIHTVLFAKLNNGMQRYKKYCADQSDDRIRRSADIKKSDIWSRIVGVKDPITGHFFDAEDLQSEAAILVSVASHPMRITVCALTHYLLNEPRCMEQLLEELHDTFGKIEEIRMGEALKACTYLQSCITETLRLSPSIPGIPLRTAKEGGVLVDGHFFPEGTDVGVATYALHHSEEYFTEPYSFVPQRWMPVASGDATSQSQTEKAREMAYQAFCAFSLGPDGCLGKTMAYTHVSIIVARMLWMLEIRRSDGTDQESCRIGAAKDWAYHKEYPLNDKFAAEGDGPWVQVRKRHFCK
jgi:cytochrome P450